MNWDEFKSWAIVVSTGIVALCAILTLFLKTIEKYPIKIGLKVMIAVLKGLKKYLRIGLRKIKNLKGIKKCLQIDLKKISVLKGLKKYLRIGVKKITILKGIKKFLQIDMKKISRGLIASGLINKVMVVAITIGITALFLDNLIPVIISEVIKKEFGIIGQEIKKDILQDIREANEKVVATLADSEVLRKVVYSDALEQANEKGYITLISEFYMTSYNWLDEERRLLTMSERRIIEECLLKHGEQDLYRLMYFVLTDDKMISELTSNKVYDVEIYLPSRLLNRSKENILFPKSYDKIEPIGKYLVAYKKHNIHLTPYDKIGIIGGYIGELRYTALTKN